MNRIPVRMTMTIEIEVPLDTTIDLDEFRDWAAEGPAGEPDAEPTEDKLLEFICSGDEGDVLAGFPHPDIRRRDHQVMEAEVTAVKIRSNA